MSHVTKTHRAIAPTKVFCPAVASANGTREHLNPRRLPNDVLAKTDFAFMNTDGTDAGNKLKA